MPKLFKITDTWIRDGQFDTKSLQGLLSLTDFTDEEFDKISDLKVGESVAFEPNIIERVE